MKENRPKRRKDRDNPYTISKENDHYYIEFMKGTYEVCRIEISKRLYEEFDSFELQDLSHMNKVDRHIERSEIWESGLFERVFQKEEDIEDAVVKKLEEERLYNAIEQLSEIQKRRLIKYYFEDKNYEEIAKEEGCSFQMVAKSVKAAIRNLKKMLR